MTSPFQLVIDANFETLGFDAQYVPLVGDPIDIKIMPRRSEEFVGFGETEIQSDANLFDVRVSELANPSNGDEIQYNGQSFFVQNASHPDGDKLLWLLDTYQE